MAQIKKRSTASGETRYDVRWRLPDGQVRTQTFATKAHATAYSTRVEGDRLRGIVVDPREGRATVKVVSKRWLAANPTKRRSSITRDQAILDHHVFPALGSHQVAQVTRADVQQVVDNWTTSLAPSTVTRQYATLRAIFAWAEASDLIGRTPCRAIRLPKVNPVDRPELQADELESLAEALGPDWAPFMWLGVVGGLRWAECAGLQVEGLDLLQGRVSVTQQLGRDGRIGPPKTVKARRSLAVPVWLIDDLASLLARRGLTGADPQALVFTTEVGGPLDYTNWRRRTWAPACAAAGLPDLRFHDLRSMAATALIAAGVDVKTAQTRLGHSSPQTTLAIYARATAKADRDAADAVGVRFRRPRDVVSALYSMGGSIDQT